MVRLELILETLPESALKEGRSAININEDTNFAVLGPNLYVGPVVGLEIFYFRPVGGTENA